MRRDRSNLGLWQLAEQYLEYCRQNGKPSSYTRDCLSVRNPGVFFGKRKLSHIHPMLIEH